MDLVTGALGKLPDKLLELLKDEYKLQSGVRAQVEFLARELECMHVALCKVAEVHHDQLDPQVRLWARDVREASCDMEDIFDTFLVHVHSGPHPAKRLRVDVVPQNAGQNWLQKILTKIGDFISNVKTRHEIANVIEGIKNQLEEMAERRARYRVDELVAKPTAIDPRLCALYTKESQLVGIDGPMNDLIKMLSLGDEDEHNNKEMKIVSIVGLGGLGKTTLAKAVHGKLKRGYDDNSKAFVSVGRNPDCRKVFKDILIDLDKKYYTSEFNLMILDEKQLIEEIREFLKNKRYFVVIDDIWEVSSWKTIRYSMVENNMGSKIIITTRNRDVAEKFGCSSYNMEPLTYESSRRLFYGRIFGSKGTCPREFSEVSKKILKKCGGVPLVICTISSLLAIKSENVTYWYELCKSIGSGLDNEPNMTDMRNILSLSYYDLPSHLKTCLLYLSIFPEDYEISIDGLIPRWIAEDFVQRGKRGDNLFDVGKSYLNELINRSMIQLVHKDDKIVDNTCRVHDVVLDLICSLSREENFVTLTDDIGKNTLLQSKVRRLSLQKRGGVTTTSMMSHARSLTIFSPAIDLMPRLLCFHSLRVLDLEGCNLGSSSQHLNLSYVGSLIQLRYLGLRDTSYADELPVEIGQLKFLQTLDLAGTKVEDLPTNVVQLKQLMFLRVHRRMRLPSGMRNLTALEELSGVLAKSSELVEELGCLTELRVLRIILVGSDQRCLKEALVQSLCCLGKIQTLDIWADVELDMQAWAPLRCLREFQVRGANAPLRLLPAWVDALITLRLAILVVDVGEVRQQDVDALGRLPALEVLHLYAEVTREALVVAGGAFPRLTDCRLTNTSSSIAPVFQPGALTQLRLLQFTFRLRAMLDAWNGSFDFGLENLGCLEKVIASVVCSDAKEPEVEAAKRVLRRAEDSHPNGATFDVTTWGVRSKPGTVQRISNASISR